MRSRSNYTRPPDRRQPIPRRAAQTDDLGHESPRTHGARPPAAQWRWHQSQAPCPRALEPWHWPIPARHRPAAPEAPVHMPGILDEEEEEEEEEAYTPSEPGSPSDDAPSPSASDGSNDNTSNDGSGVDEEAGEDAATTLLGAVCTHRFIHAHAQCVCCTTPPGSRSCRPGCLMRTPARLSGRPSSICARATRRTTRSRVRPLSARRSRAAPARVLSIRIRD